ncbi:MAG: hypothetical protein HC825_09650 [Oscillatoriales cyanobacterium RM1_1_9]|nr:hypothetical protein [Oscillatoriales cyanobacterium SM2_3_0]NJO44223.1 hypothetical protein [Oscillatoriales cyanobacterium RM2_1_1]NJO71858.1 hypothetical protein [Oscillatoriales cyanobacterium RM1_1_9]
MEELRHLATWVKEQHAPEYILTWLLNQPGIWWSNGEVYQAAIHRSGTQLKDYVKKHQQGDLFQGIADKVVDDQVWDSIAVSLATIMATYQEELVKLKDQNRLRVMARPLINRPTQTSDEPWPELEIQQPLPDLSTDALTGL